VPRDLRKLGPERGLINVASEFLGHDPEPFGLGQPIQRVGLSVLVNGLADCHQMSHYGGLNIYIRLGQQKQEGSNPWRRKGLI